MTETARALASRANARKSTGPKTPAGKSRARRNARRHGLTLPVLMDPAFSLEVDDLARRIEKSVTGAHLDARRHELACRVAEALIDLKRVRTAKLPLVAALDADIEAAAGPLKQLLRLDRYERRALSRRKIAIREFDANLAPPHPSRRARGASASRRMGRARKRSRLGRLVVRDASLRDAPHHEAGRRISLSSLAISDTYRVSCWIAHPHRRTSSDQASQPAPR